MRNGILAAIVTLAAGAGLASAQAPAPLAPPPPADPAAPNYATPPVVADQGPAAGSRLWASAEYLLWWTKDSHLPNLVITGWAPPGGTVTTMQPGPFGSTITTSSSAAPPPPSLGPDVLFGGNVDSEDRSGGRFFIGCWLDSDETIGVEGGYFFLGRRSFHFDAASPGNPGLAIPFFDAAAGQESSYIVAQPAQSSSSQTWMTGFFFGPFSFPISSTDATDAYAGTVAVSGFSRLQGAEANTVCNLLAHPACRVDLLAGFRFADLDEGLRITSTVTHTHTETSTPSSIFFDLPPTVNDYTSVVTRNDQFDTRNKFYGGQLGARTVYCLGRLFITASGKVALGEMHQTVDINGSGTADVSGSATPNATDPFTGITYATGPAQSYTTHQSLPGGLFAQPTNIGHYHRDVFAVLPEGNLQLGYALTDFMHVTVGYTFFYMNKVVRPGDQIDRGINPAQLALSPSAGDPARPAFRFNESDFWAQGIDFGLEFHY